MIAPPGPRMGVWQEAVTRAAEGLRRIVKIGVLGARTEANGALAEHGHGEAILRGVDVE